MRSLALVLPASLVFAVIVQGQALTEHAAAAAGAAVGTGAGKSLSDSMTKIFGDTDKQTAQAAKPDAKKASKPPTTPAAAPTSNPVATRSIDSALDPLPPSGSRSASQPSARAARKPILEDTTAATLARAAAMSPLPPEAPIAEPIVKVPTVQDIANVKVGTTADDLLTALGQPSSRVSIPDDDGHLRETCQYWANGRQIGTVRLDNGQVVAVETRPEN
jgi:hypothetical protein